MSLFEGEKGSLLDWAVQEQADGPVTAAAEGDTKQTQPTETEESEPFPVKYEAGMKPAANVPGPDLSGLGCPLSWEQGEGKLETVAKVGQVPGSTAPHIVGGPEVPFSLPRSPLQPCRRASPPVGPFARPPFYYTVCLSPLKFG
ncbi:hypothetical protein I7I51_07072 [Histoplasma capsulatum]|uniref:Uncharacterized protein n=1 Tax=Ajellomyces capsulatus TaxID=5037 RepID=A0A8A1MHW1_AJECA|nr:hypothetical protein I7I51_07072 [Histoplasma capsulatum]